MCGIVGYIGKNKAADYLLDGLQTLEYRGYDSAGIAVLDGASINVEKVTGRVEHLRRAIEESKKISSRSELEPISSDLREAQANRTTGTKMRASKVSMAEVAEKTVVSQTSSESRQSGSVCEIGIGHTRWATHGGVLVKNAHPHLDNKNQFAVIHNGIIENYQEIKKLLIKNGYIFHSDTDTEVVPNLIDFNFRKLKDVEKAFISTIQALRGAYAIVMTTTHDTETLYAAKLSSPLAIGVGDEELFIGSDALPIISHTQQIVFLEDSEIAIVKRDGYRIIDVKTEKIIDRPAELVDLEEAVSDIGDFPDFMSKEMHEAPQTVRSAMLGRLKIDEGIVKLGGLDLVKHQLDYIDRIIIIACGTSYYAGLIGEYLIEEIADIPVEVQQASEFRYRNEPLSRSTAVLVISQSGETADTIAALKKLEGTGILCLGIVNAPGSTLARMTDAGVYCHAGPEKAVASTKAFIAQVTVLILISLYMSKNYSEYKLLTKDLNNLPKQLEKVLDLEPQIAKVAKKYAHHRDFLYIGRRYAYPVALEGALKIKEISYIHAEGFAGGEMKHGPLALIDENFPTFAIALSNDLEEKSMSNMQEIHARGGPIVALVDDINSEASKLATDVIVIPKVAEPLQPILSAVVTHLFAYHAAKTLGRDIDKPRNLAKSVTVE
jgi:glutamine---fructose-6-phosphate transaminase (isomerizing)